MELHEDQKPCLEISIPFTITPVSYFIQRCRKNEFETAMMVKGIKVNDISFQKFIVCISFTITDNTLSEDDVSVIIKEWITELSKNVAVIPLFEEFNGTSFVTQRESIEVRSERYVLTLLLILSNCTIFCSTDFNIYYYVGYFDYYTSFTAILHGLNDPEPCNVLRSIDRDDLSSVAPFRSHNLYDSRTVAESVVPDTRSTFSAPVFSSVSKDLSFVLPQQSRDIEIPEFSLKEPKYIPRHSLIYNDVPSPIYLDVLRKHRDTTCIFSNAELSDFAVITMAEQICRLLGRANMIVTGFYFNSCGWYVRYQGDQASVDDVRQVYQQCVKGVSFLRHIRIQLSLSDEEYISLLIYVAEVSNG